MFSDSKANILLVDDHVENLIALEASLAVLGENLVQVTSAQDALRCLLKQDFAVILLDVQMPEMDGFEVATLIRQRERSQHTPIIFITAFNADDLNQMQGYSIGAVDYLLKPIDPTILVSKVSVFVDLHKKNQALQRQAAELSAQRVEIIQEQLARQQAEAANRMKDEFLAIISHELRTPLNSILGWAKLLESKKLDAETTRRALEVIGRNARSQSQLIDDILDVARLMRGKLTISQTPVNLLHLVAIELESLRPAAAAKEIQLALHTPTAACTVLGDAERLQQIIRNLLSNAIKFTPTGGVVEIAVALLPNHCTTDTVWLETRPNQSAIDSIVQLTVKDSGVGINPEFLPHIFEYFRQADSSTTRSHGGLGLGLAIVRQLVDMHGGRIYAASEGADKGATFTVHLPALATPAIADPVSPTSPRLEDLSLEGVVILVVDDNSDNLEFVTTILKRAAAEVVAATTVQEAINYLKDQQPSILVSDIAMPEEDGYSLLQRVNQLDRERGTTTPAIALSAFTKKDNQVDALAAGFQVFISKPFDPLDLIQAIAQLTHPTQPSLDDSVANVAPQAESLSQTESLELTQNSELSIKE